ncbi:MULTISPECIES: peptide chain release factor N(5)-glutamine methyltransferase [unclassified Psychrobacter]|uniref:peptide chain release factor N(5)-glutamine methyltransferase n=1 Tax=unclassified Psychrobacter TaxID=196806 RepID=UPI0025B4F0EA|nr:MULTISPECIES: peptide chain release factor N(5)-glutamine methyltransferase [unclassified Psychrobacter]MDN3452427.1 peptide chain release factor N(5)-glutamine methyltransferase [Psychrobacter sp. APC 3350]MDN3502434.1 peptide chain release factor N(5)-glutamine methyltransferase [Psychrobacter sp. 5A.1]
MTVSTIRQIKQQIGQLTNGESSHQTPSFWLTDWLLHVIDKPAIALMTDEGYQLTDSELEQFNTGVTKMQAGIPLAYLTGQQEFWSLPFTVNEHTLIPRPDTEVLVEQVLNWINAQPAQLSNKRLLDLGTGSGCIAISLAHELKQANWQVVAVDLSSEALKVAQHNAVSNNVANIEFIQSSWYQALPTGDEQQFDVIVSNPPYIDEEDEHLAHLKAEPISALSAPNQGLADIEHIVQQATTYLCTGGLLAIEHGYDQGDAVRKLFLDNGFELVHTVKDYGGNDRVTLGRI